MQLYVGNQVIHRFKGWLEWTWPETGARSEAQVALTLLEPKGRLGNLYCRLRIWLRNCLLQMQVLLCFRALRFVPTIGMSVLDNIGPAVDGQEKLT